MKKRRHHYVFQRYLQAWSVEGRVSCLRDGKVFACNTLNLAVERDFYKLRELTDGDLFVIKSFAIKAAPLLQQLHQGWINTFRGLFDLRNSLAAMDRLDEEAQTALDNAEHNLEEDLHACIESSAIKYLDALREGDVSFLASADEFGRFAYFLGVQYMRTKKLREVSLDAVGDIPLPDFDAGRAWGLLSNILATNIGYGVMARHSSTTATLLEAPPDEDFTTADQPVINLHAHRKPQDEEATKLTMYYSVSPRRALLVEVDHGKGQVETRQTDAAGVQSYNEMLYDMSHEQVFASSAEQLAQWASR